MSYFNVDVDLFDEDDGTDMVRLPDFVIVQY
jgi:hypothetical protein